MSYSTRDTRDTKQTAVYYSDVNLSHDLRPPAIRLSFMHRESRTLFLDQRLNESGVTRRSTTRIEGE